MLKNEIVKILNNKILLYVLAVALLLNGGLICWQQYNCSENYMCNYKDYNELCEEIEGLSEQKKLAYITEKLEALDILVQEDAITKQFLYEEMLAEVEPVANYSSTIQAISKNSEKILKRLNMESNSYNYERVIMSMEVYEGLEDVEPYHQPSRGILLFMDNVSTDALIVLCILFTVVIAITYEREKNLLILSKCTKYGKKKHAIVKIGAVLIIGFIATLLLNIETLIISSCFYDLGDLTRPIQSVAGYSLCVIETSVIGYIAIYIAIKFLFFCMCAALFYLISCIFRRAFAVYLVSTGIVVALVIAYSLIPEASYLINLKHFNPVSFGQVEEMLSQLQCIDIFGHAVDKTKISIICTLVLATVMFGAGVLVYARTSEKEINGFKGLGLIKRNRYHTSVIGHEFYKTFVVQHVALIHIVGLLVAYAIFSTQSVNAGGDFYQKAHAENIEGRYDSSVDEYIETCLTKVEEEMFSYEGSKDDNTYLSYELEEMALQSMEQYASYLKEKPNSYYIYNSGYQALTGNVDDITDQNVMLAIITSVFAVVVFTASISIDYQRGEDKLIRSTVNGKRKYIASKCVTGVVSCAILYSSIWLPTLISMLNEYGTEFIDAPAYSLQHLSWLPEWVSIGGYIAFIYVVRFIGLLVIMLCTFYIAKKLRSNSLTVLVAIAIFVGPLILYLLGIDEMRYLSLFWLH